MDVLPAVHDDLELVSCGINMDIGKKLLTKFIQKSIMHTSSRCEGKSVVKSPMSSL